MPLTTDQPGEQPRAARDDVPRQEVVHPDGYPRTMVRGGIHRTVPNVAEETRLRFSGWRLEEEPEPERGSFLPAPTTAAAAESQAPTHARPAPRRKS